MLLLRIFVLFALVHICFSLYNLPLERRYQLLQQKTAKNGMKEQNATEPIEGGTSVGLYFIELEIGTPPQPFTFQCIYNNI